MGEFTGRQRCVEAKTIHGHETREARTERSLDSERLAVLEVVGHELGLMGGTRTRGIKLHKMGQVLMELQEAVRRLRLKMPHDEDVWNRISKPGQPIPAAYNLSAA